MSETASAAASQPVNTAVAVAKGSSETSQDQPPNKKQRRVSEDPDQAKEQRDDGSGDTDRLADTAAARNDETPTAVEDATGKTLRSVAAARYKITQDMRDHPGAVLLCQKDPEKPKCQSRSLLEGGLLMGGSGFLFTELPHDKTDFNPKYLKMVEEMFTTFRHEYLPDRFHTRRGKATDTTPICLVKPEHQEAWRAVLQQNPFIRRAVGWQVYGVPLKNAIQTPLISESDLVKLYKKVKDNCDNCETREQCREVLRLEVYGDATSQEETEDTKPDYATYGSKEQWGPGFDEVANAKGADNKDRKSVYKTSFLVKDKKAGNISGLSMHRAIHFRTEVTVNRADDRRGREIESEWDFLQDYTAFRTCSGTCRCMGALAITCTGYHGKHSIEDTLPAHAQLPGMQYDSIHHLQPKMQVLLEQIRRFPEDPLYLNDDGRYDGLDPIMLDSLVAFEDCFTDAFQSGNKKYYLLGMDNRPTTVANGLPGGPLPMCRNGIIYLFSHSGVKQQQTANMIHAVVDSRTVVPSSFDLKEVETQARDENGSILINTFYRSKGRYMLLRNEFLVFFTKLHAEAGTVLLGNQAMPWLPYTKEYTMELWYSGQYGGQTKALPVTSNTLHGFAAKGLRQLLGFESKSNGDPIEKQTVSGATMVIAHHGIKFKHSEPKEAGAVDIIWPLSGTGLKYKKEHSKDLDTFYQAKFYGSMRVLQVHSEGLKAMSELAKLEVPLVPNSAGTTTFCGKVMGPYTSAVKTWRSATFPPNRIAHDSTEEESVEVMLRGAPDAFSDIQKQAVRELLKWGKEVACGHVHSFEAALPRGGFRRVVRDNGDTQAIERGAKDISLDLYKAVAVVSYQQGRLSTEVGLTTVPHKTFHSETQEDLRLQKGVHSVLIDIPLDEYGCFQRFFLDFDDQKGRTIYTSFGSALIYPAMLSEEVGWITHVKGNPRLRLRVFVSSCYGSEAELSNAIGLGNNFASFERREYPHIPVTSRAQKDTTTDWEEKLRVVHKREYPQEGANNTKFCNNIQKEPVWFDRFKQSHDYKMLYETFAFA